MAKYIGVDWASSGWFGVILDDEGDWTTDLFPSIWSLWKYHSDASKILVDIPIGLPSTDRRACDVEAKSILGPRQRTIFYAPIREAVYQQNLDDAKAINEAEAGYSIQNQAWSIVPRIREIDEFLDMYPSARDRLLETHPEVCFYALNGRTALSDPKTTAEGIDRRIELLAEEFADVRSLYDDSVERYRTPSYAPMIGGDDDILDALVAAVTARRTSENRSTLPEGRPPTDDRGLPMQTVYPGDSAQTRLSSLEQ